MFTEYFSEMVLDISLFREEAGADLNVIRRSQAARFDDPLVVENIIDKDKQWRERRFIGDKLNAARKTCSKAVGVKMKNKVSLI